MSPETSPRSESVRTTPEAAEKPLSSAPSFPVVAVGASSGGLTAFRELLENLPVDTGMAYILIPHLDPSHPSLMSDILSRATRMPVVEAADGLPIRANHAYVISPNSIMTVEDEKLQLVPRNLPPHRKHECIDHFMTSLARQYREQAIGVVLSGTAADGSVGVTNIKEEGGITFAQDDSAEYLDMPRNAIATGCIDFVLSPSAIAKEIGSIGRHPYVRKIAPVRAPNQALEPGEERIFALLKKATGVDFSQYKQTTIGRRMARRMAVRKIETLGDYVHFVEHHPEEAKALHDDLLIHVTSFFRDPEAFEALKTGVFPEIVKSHVAGDPIRMWTAGCSSGEEAYSLLIALSEYLQDAKIRCDIQMFGTDISDGAVEKARAGIYDASIAEDVSAERLRRYFVPVDGGGWRITKGIRDLCVFARQDVARDPPFSRLDLLSCRNMLIYLGTALQRRVIPLFHYSLKPDGFLLLGSSESVDSYPQLFALLDRKHKTYRKLSGWAYDSVSFPVNRAPFREAGRTDAGPAAANAAFDVGRAADRYLLSHGVPGAIVLNDRDQVVELRGNTEPYLRMAAGKVSPSAVRMLREDLVPEIDRIVRRARETGVPTRQEGVRFRVGDQLRETAIDVVPLGEPGGKPSHYLVQFTDAPAPGAPPRTSTSSAPPATSSEVERENARLRAELGAHREYQQAIVEKLETVNEELRSASEETLSANEELQSTNEELETSKEELQSANEELTTLNDELRQKNLELGELNSDLANVILGANVALVIVDSDLRLKRFTPQAEKILSLVPTDVGRRILDFKAASEIPNLEPLIRGVLETLTPAEQEFRDGAGHWYSLRLRPYRDSENRIKGVVLVLVDVDLIKKSLIALEEATAVTTGIVETVQVPLLILSRDFRVHRANPAYYGAFQSTPAETENQSFFDLVGGQWDLPELRRLIEEILPKDSHFEGKEIRRSFQGLGERVMLVNGRRIKLENAGDPKVLLSFEDVTARRHAEEELARLNAGLERRVNERTTELQEAKGEMEAFTYSVAHDLRAPLRAMGGFAQALLDDYIDRPIDAEGQGFARRIMDSAQKMDTLIQDLLSYSRLTRDAVLCDRLELNPLIDAVLVELSREIQDRGAEVRVDRPLPAVRGHRNSAFQALLNLVGNALKFVAPGVRPAVRVRAESQDGRVRIWVEDNGIGFDPKHRDRIFRVFERLHTIKEYPGTGIGLAIVQRAMERMGGTLGVESEPGKGSRFWIEFPPV